MERHMIRMVLRVRLIDKVSNDVLRDKICVVVKIDDIIQSRLRLYGHVTCGDINSKYVRLWKLK